MVYLVYTFYSYLWKEDLEMDSIFDLWDSVLEKLHIYIQEGRLSEPGYNIWIKILNPISINGNEVVLESDSDFKRGIVEENYSYLIEECFESVLGFPVDITYVTAKSDEAYAASLPPTMTNFNITDSNYTFSNFVVGSSNSFAHAASLAVADHPATAYNPLFIYGNSGVGKTHLLLAIHNHIKERYPAMRQVYVSTENFTNDVISSIQRGRDAIDGLRKKFRDVDVLMMDDIQFIAGKNAVQEEFFNTFNNLLQNEKQIVLTSDRPPRDIKTLDERIRFRFEGALLSDIGPPDFETRVGILKRKAEALSLDLSDDVVYYVAEQVKTNIRQLEGVIKKFNALTSIEGSKVDMLMARNVIRDIKTTEIPDPITPDKIITEVSRTYTISESDIVSKKKNAPIVAARQAAIYITRQILGMTYQKIGEAFGIDHSTVVHSLKKIEILMSNNPREKEIIEDVIRNLRDKRNV